MWILWKLLKKLKKKPKKPKMLDKPTLDKIPEVHPRLRAELLQIYKEISAALSAPVGCRFTHILRTFQEQNEIYAQGRTKPGAIVTNAKGGQSYHNYGLAVDFVLTIDKDGNGKPEQITWNRTVDLDRDQVADWMEVVKIFTKYGWTWGASFGDFPHFEKTFGYNWRKLLELKTSGKVDKQGYVLI